MKPLPKQYVETLISESGDSYLPIVYHDPAIFEHEMDAIFGRCWQFVGHVSQIPGKGDFFLSRIGEENVIVSRGGDDKVHVMLNMCRHRGHIVCPAAHGNTKRFVCPFHGWTYAPDGRLLSAPMTSELAPDMKKENYGLVHVPRVETYRGLIFANFDAGAKPLVEELGDLTFYLDAMVGRREEDTIVIGGIHKWETRVNWKIGPDGMGGDFYHTPFTHASLLSAEPDIGETIKDMSDPARARNIAFDGGHGFNAFLLPEGLPEESYFPVEPRILEIPEVREYFTAIQPEARERLGDIRNRLKINTGTIFPNLSFSPGIFTLRLTLPKGPGRVENWCWVLGYKDMPQIVRDTMLQAYLFVFGPDGRLEQDDAEAWKRVTDGTRTRQGRNVALFAGLGTDEFRTDPDLPGYQHHPMSEGVSRGYLRRWREQMLATAGQE